MLQITAGTHVSHTFTFLARVNLSCSYLKELSIWFGSQKSRTHPWRPPFHLFPYPNHHQGLFIFSSNPSQIHALTVISVPATITLTKLPISLAESPVSSLLTGLKILTLSFGYARVFLVLQQG